MQSLAEHGVCTMLPIVPKLVRERLTGNLTDHNRRISLACKSVHRLLMPILQCYGGPVSAWRGPPVEHRVFVMERPGLDRNSLCFEWISIKFNRAAKLVKLSCTWINNQATGQLEQRGLSTPTAHLARLLFFASLLAAAN